MILRRKSKNADATEEVSADPAPELPETRNEGPWDVEEADVAGDASYVDLGGLIVKGRPGFEVQIPPDPKTGRPAAVVLFSEEAALELRAFASKRSGGLWEDVRSDIAGEATRLKGECEVHDGRHGPELRLRVPTKTTEGADAVQPSRIVGVEGPRWFLRGTFYGKAAVEPDDDGVLESAFRDVVVRRGDGPMAPREVLEITIPDGAVAKDA